MRLGAFAPRFTKRSDSSPTRFGIFISDTDAKERGESIPSFKREGIDSRYALVTTRSRNQ